MKLLFEKYNILSINKNLILEKNKWIMEYTNLNENEEAIKFVTIRDDNFNQLKTQAFQRLPIIEESVSNKITLENQSLKKFA